MITTLTKFEEKVREVGVQVAEEKIVDLSWNAPGTIPTYRKSKEKIEILTNIANDWRRRFRNYLDRLSAVGGLNLISKLYLSGNMPCIRYACFCLDRVFTDPLEKNRYSAKSLGSPRTPATLQRLRGSTEESREFANSRLWFREFTRLYVSPRSH